MRNEIQGFQNFVTQGQYQNFQLKSYNFNLKTKSRSKSGRQLENHNKQ